MGREGRGEKLLKRGGGGREGTRHMKHCANADAFLLCWCLKHRPKNKMVQAKQLKRYEGLRWLFISFTFLLTYLGTSPECSSGSLWPRLVSTDATSCFVGTGVVGLMRFLLVWRSVGGCSDLKGTGGFFVVHMRWQCSLPARQKGETMRLKVIRHLLIVSQLTSGQFGLFGMFLEVFIWRWRGHFCWSHCFHGILERLVLQNKHWSELGLAPEETAQQ